NDCSHSQRAGCIGHALRMVTAGISDHTAACLLIIETYDFVVSATQLERTNRLQIFRLEIEQPTFRESILFVKVRLQQRRPHNHVLQADLGFSDVIQRYDGCSPTRIYPSFLSPRGGRPPPSAFPTQTAVKVFGVDRTSLKHVFLNF